MSEKKTGGTLTSYLSFRLGEEMFSADVSKVLEILEMRAITKVPRSPSYMRGVINLRGSVLPVLDTRIKFGMAATEDTVDTCIVVLNVIMEGEPLTLGALVDSVEEVLELTEADIEAPPTIGSKFNPEYMHGMVKMDDSFIMVLNVDKVFSTDELVMVAETADKVQSENAETQLQ
ncbi:MAG: chemotaxis protein CheW [Bacteroidetes bacterium]|nr:MAG: chemotaxis protein CheW [Bacteroidota bacterium]